MKVGESGDQARNASARRLHFHGNRDRISVIFDAEDDGQLAERSGVHGFPEFAFTRSAVAQRNISDLVAPGRDVLKLAVVRSAGLRDLACFRMASEIASTLGTAYRLQNLRSGRRRLSHDMQRRVAPVGG